MTASRGLTGQSNAVPASQNSIETCAAACSAYTYFGLEYASVSLHQKCDSPEHIAVTCGYIASSHLEDCLMPCPPSFEHFEHDKPTLNSPVHRNATAEMPSTHRRHSRLARVQPLPAAEWPAQAIHLRSAAEATDCPFIKTQYLYPQVPVRRQPH